MKDEIVDQIFSANSKGDALFKPFSMSHRNRLSSKLQAAESSGANRRSSSKELLQGSKEEQNSF